MNTKLTAVAAAAVLSAGLAQASTDLSLERFYALSNDAAGYDSLLTSGNANNLKVTALWQFQYQVNSRDDVTPSDDETTLGFNMRRTEIYVTGDVTDNIWAKVKFAFSNSTGDATLDDAFANWKINDDFTLQMGQFKPEALREVNVGNGNQLAVDRSVTSATFGQGYTQGVQGRFGGDSWRMTVGFNDGFNTKNSAFNAPAESDYAFNGRFEMLFGDASWDQFKNFTSWRGSNSGGMLGIAAAYQSAGDTNPSSAPDSDMTTATVDFSWVADGWNLYAAGIYQSMDSDTTDSVDNYGLVAQGGFFVTDQDELYARYDAIFPDDEADNGGGVGSGSDDFSTITVGWNHYLVPESQSAKFTLELNFYLDETTDSIVSTSANGAYNLLTSSEDSQFGLTAQMQLLF